MYNPYIFTLKIFFTKSYAWTHIKRSAIVYHKTCAAQSKTFQASVSSGLSFISLAA